MAEREDSHLSPGGTVLTSTQLLHLGRLAGSAAEASSGQALLPYLPVPEVGLMAMYERILLAVDTSEHSRKAVAAAAEIAGRFQSEVLVVHVREPGLAETGDHLETEREAAELAEWAAGILQSAGARIQIRVSSSGRRGVAGAILAAVTDFQPGLIIMGSRGLTELTGLLLGSVSHKLIQLADCPVLVVR